MAIFPSVQRKAQNELDTVLGPSRVPTIDDVPSLPYLRAVLMEIMRWSPTLPVGVPHRAMQEDKYGGYIIPAGTIVYPVRPCFPDDTNVRSFQLRRTSGSYYDCSVLAVV